MKEREINEGERERKSGRGPTYEIYLEGARGRGSRSSFASDLTELDVPRGPAGTKEGSKNSILRVLS